MEGKYSFEINAPYNLKSVDSFLESLKKSGMKLLYPKSKFPMNLGGFPDKDIRNSFGLEEKEPDPNTEYLKSLYWKKAYTDHCKRSLEQGNILRWDFNIVEVPYRKILGRKFDSSPGFFCSQYKDVILKNLSISENVLNGLIQSGQNGDFCTLKNELKKVKKGKVFEVLYGTFEGLDDKNLLLSIMVNQSGTSSFFVKIPIRGRGEEQGELLKYWRENGEVSNKECLFSYEGEVGRSGIVDTLLKKIREGLEEKGWSRNCFYISRRGCEENFLRTNLLYKSLKDY